MDNAKVLILKRKARWWFDGEVCEIDASLRAAFKQHARRIIAQPVMYNMLRCATVQKDMSMMVIPPVRLIRSQILFRPIMAASADSFAWRIIMRSDEIFNSGGGGKGPSQAYWNALRKLRSAWSEVYGEELEAHGSLAMERYESALEHLKERIRKDTRGKKQLLEILDVEPEEEIDTVLLEQADLDDLSPNAIKAAIFEQIRHRGRGRHELRAILREALKTLFNNSGTRRPKVGSNRHWPRLLQYLRELENENDWSPDGQGVRLVNLGGRGPVAKVPRDPGRLSVMVDPDFI